MWSEKYRPKDLDELLGNEKIQKQFLTWLGSWETGKSGLLIGPPGVGKTTLVHLSALKLGFNLIELNASDVRSKKKLELFFDPLLKNHNLFNQKNLILLDEIDGIHGRSDYGAVEFLIKIIENIGSPVVMTANSSIPKIKKLIKKSKVFSLTPISNDLIEKFLYSIVEKENFELDEDIIKQISDNSRGDVRSSVNDLQMHLLDSSSDVVNRDISISLEDSISNLFHSDTFDQAMLSLSLCNSPPHEKINYIFNIILNSTIKPDELHSTLESLSEIDIIVGQIRNTNDWRLLRYIDKLLALCIFINISKQNSLSMNANVEWNILLRMWNESPSIKQMATSFGKELHFSKRNFSMYYPYLTLILTDSKILSNIFEQLDLGDTQKNVFIKEYNRIKNK